MKIYYTTDRTIDDNLQQVCPFGELHHFNRTDGSEITIPKYVGCGGCENCKYCYGRGFHGYYHNSEFIIIPKNFESDDLNYERNERKKIELGIKQFNVVQKNDYIYCAKCYTDKFREKNKMLKFKIWWWHHVGIKIDRLKYNIDKFYSKFNTEILFSKLKKKFTKVG